MSYWELGSTDGTFILSLEAVDEDGDIVTPPSMVWYLGVGYPVAGRWVAADPTRAKNSGFTFCGQTPNPNPIFLSASGIMFGQGSSPTKIQIYVTQVNSENAGEVAWDGELEPNAPYTLSIGPWTILENGNTLGSLVLELNGEQLSATGTWTPPGANSEEVSVGVTWYGNKLSWWANGNLFESEEFSSSSCHGTYGTGPKRQNGSWTASQSR